MRRPISLVVSAACLVFLGSAAPAHAEPGEGLFDRVATAWMGVVGVIGADEEAADEIGMTDPLDHDADDRDENTFTIDEDGEDEGDEEGEEARKQHRGRRDADRAKGGHRHHRGGHAHGGPHHRGPRHPGMGPGPMGPPGGPDVPHAALRAFREISRRLARIEEKLGVENGPPSGPMGERPWGPPPEMRERRGAEGPAGRPRPEMPEEMRRQMKQRMEQGRERMEEARAKFRTMEERIKQLEAEVERLKAVK